jgi:exopolyphosphatase/guanosine-5'-triphosphate,3'-diphosphate pyrophosphatase
VIARLGKGVDAQRRIPPETIERCIRFLARYRARADAMGADKIVATGTSALRDAVNREEFIARVKSGTGLSIEILPGEEEAVRTYLGAISGLQGLRETRAVLDIGGGSTELTVGGEADIRSSVSLDVGSVRVTERFLPSSPPSPAELEAATLFVDGVVSSYPRFDGGEISFIGVAGTVTTLAALELGLREYDGGKVAGFVLTREMIDRRFALLRGLTHDQIRAELAIDEGRADIILAGILILRRVMERQDVNEVIVSERGLRYGIALRETGAR